MRSDYRFYQDLFCKVGSLNVRYWDVGKGAVTLVFIHGLGGSAEEWGFTIHRLEEKYRCIIVDMPGFGRSDKPMDAPYTYSYFSLFLDEFLSQLHIRRCILVGHSMGGMIALMYTLAHPENVEKLALVAPPFGRNFLFAFHLATVPRSVRFLPGGREILARFRNHFAFSRIITSNIQKKYWNGILSSATAKTMRP